MPPKKDNTNEATKAPESPVDATESTANPIDGVAGGESQAPENVSGDGNSGAEPNQSDAAVEGGHESAEAVHIGDSLDGPDSASAGNPGETAGEASPSVGSGLVGDDPVSQAIPTEPGNEGNLNGSGDLEPTAGSEAGNQSQSEQGGDDDAGAEPDANPNTGERDENRLSRGLDDDVELKEPEEEPEAVAPDSVYTLRYAEVWTQINELQKLIDGTGIQLVVDSYQQTAKVVVPEYATLPAQFEGLKLAQ